MNEERSRKRARLVMAIIQRKWREVWSLLGLDRADCRSCGTEIWWFATEGGKKMPVDNDGVSHFANCPNADRHRRPR